MDEQARKDAAQYEEHRIVTVDRPKAQGEQGDNTD